MTFPRAQRSDDLIDIGFLGHDDLAIDLPDCAFDGRIIGVADVFDALANRRVYPEAWTLGGGVCPFPGTAGRHFDPELADIFLENKEEFKTIRARYNAVGLQFT